METLPMCYTILIAVLAPGTLAIIALCYANKLVCFFRSRFRHRTSRIALGFVGVVFSVIGIILLRGSLIFALVFLFFGISILWSVFRGADKGISEWWEILSWWH